MNYEEELEKFRVNHLGDDFEFRKYQKEVIIDIIKTYFEGTKSYVLQAPTGSGKSIVAMCVAGVLNTLGKRGYILTSELSLHTQYENDIKKYKLPFGYLKGIDNYFCSENMEKHSLGECHIRNIPSKQIPNLSCYNDCEYYVRRNDAISKPTAVLTYAYWLLQRNYVAKNMPEEPFDIRDFIICDEAHKVTDIVQNHFSPRIDIMTNSQLEKLRQFITSKEFGKVRTEPKDLSKTIDNMFKEENQDRLAGYLSDFEEQLSCFEEKATNIKEFIAKKYAFKSVPKDWRYGMFLCDWVKDMHCKFEDYNIIIKNTGNTALIKNPTEESVTFNCIDESYLMKKHYHDESNFQVFMSATIGDAKTFAKLSKIENCRAISLKSTFDYEKSPIFAFVGKKMSYGEKAESFPWIVEKVKEIAELHKNESGIIHTGSYAFSRDLYSALSTDLRKRILFYTNSEEKKDCLREFETSSGKILIGPSLLEGLDLSGDKSRFQIFMKIPFPSLADRFVKAKLDEDHGWYDHRTCLCVCQGIGRSVRSIDDYAVSYILDGCFVTLFKRNQGEFSEDFKERLVWVQHDAKRWSNMRPIKL